MFEWAVLISMPFESRCGAFQAEVNPLDQERREDNRGAAIERRIVHVKQKNGRKLQINFLTRYN